MSIWNKDYSFTPVGNRVEVDLSHIAVIPLLKDVLQSKGKKLYEASASGFTEKDLDFFLEAIDKVDGRLVYEAISEGYISRIFISEYSAIEFDYNEKTLYVMMSIYSQKEDLVRSINKIFNDNLKPAARQGNIFAITANGGRLGLNVVGAAGIPLHEKNYNPEVIHTYKESVKDLRSSSPSGRIIILEGEPGTGKTHLIRAFLMEVPDAMFVLVSPDMVPSLGGPELLPLLMAHKGSYGAHAPIILVLEDADKCLVTRAGDNINSIQSLLNLGDGILGSMLDLRIIATTNAKKLELEPALLRPGRLSQRLEVGPLNADVARTLFASLCPDYTGDVPEKIAGDSTVTLAEVYFLARKNGWDPEPAKNIDEPSPSYDDDEDDYH